MARTKRKSRATRWAEAVSDAQEGLAALREAFSALEDLKQEYADWLGNLPENLHSSPLGDKLQAMENFDFDGALDDIENTVSEAESADLPLGFGRD